MVHGSSTVTSTPEEHACALTDWFHDADGAYFSTILRRARAPMIDYRVDGLTRRVYQTTGKVHTPFVSFIGQNSGHFCSPNRIYDSFRTDAVC